MDIIPVKPKNGEKHMSNSVVALNNAMEQWSYSNCDGSYFNCNEIKAAL